MAEKPCCAHPIVKGPFVIPAGAIVGLAATVVGYIGWLQLGLGEIKTTVDNIKLTLPREFDAVMMWMPIAFIVADGLVILYGLREKVRICCNWGNHCTTCFPTLVKFLFKGLINLIVVVALALVLILMVLFEGMFVVFWVINTMCTSGTKSSVETVMGLLGQSTSDLDSLCAAGSSGKNGALNGFIGSAICVVGQIIVLAYWMKYSTLGNVVPFWTTGKYAEGGDATEKDVELVATIDPEVGKAPRKF